MPIEIWRHPGNSDGYWTQESTSDLQIAAGDRKGSGSGFTISVTIPVPHGSSRVYFVVPEDSYSDVVAAMMERSPYKAERTFLEAMLKKKRAVKRADRETSWAVRLTAHSGH